MIESHLIAKRFIKNWEEKNLTNSFEESRDYEAIANSIKEEFQVPWENVEVL